MNVPIEKDLKGSSPSATTRGAGGLASLPARLISSLPLDSRRFLVVLWTLMVVARLALAFYVFSLPRHPDEDTYLRIATAVAEGKGYAIHGHATAIVVPVFPLLLAGLLKVFGSVDAPLAVLHVLLGLAMAFAYGRIQYRLTGSRPVARLTEIAIFLLPPYMEYSGYVLTEILFSTLLTFTFLFLDTVSRDPTRLGGWVALAFFHTLAFLTRPVTALVTPLVWLWPLILGKFRRKALLGAAMGGVVFLALWGPWCLRNELVFHHWVPLSSFSGFTLMAANLDNPAEFSALSKKALKKAGIQNYYDNEIASNEVLVREAKRRINADKLGWIRRTITRSWRVWLAEYPSYFGLKIRFRKALSSGRIDLLALKSVLLGINILVPLLGLFGIVRFIRVKEAWPWIGALAYFTVIHAALFPINRYGAPVAGLAVMLGLAALFKGRGPLSAGETKSNGVSESAGPSSEIPPEKKP